MRNLTFLFSLFLLTSIPLCSQEYDEKMVVAKGCEKIQDNLELKHCLREKLSNAFSRRIGKKLIYELKPGINKFNLGIKIKANKDIELVYLNTLNSTIKKEFERRLNKVKILKSGFVGGQYVDAVFKLPIQIKDSTPGISVIHKMSKIVDKNDYKGSDEIYPEIDVYCLSKENKEENFQCFNEYIKNFFFNSVDINQIKSILSPGMNFFEAKIDYNANDKITEIRSLSNHEKLNTIFKKHLSNVFENSGFKSPAQDDISYAGEMTFYFFYMNP